MFRLCSLVAVVGAAMGALPAAAQGVAYADSYRRADFGDAAVIALGGGLYLVDYYLVPRRSEPLWDGPVLWDRPLRQALRLDVQGKRETAEDVSDVLFAGSVVHNLLFDNLFVAWGLHGERETAFQMSVADLEAYAVAGALTGLVKTAAGRARPYARECRRNPGYSRLCGTANSYRAFFSAHATTTAVGAGLLCAHHLELPLYDGGPLDVGACVTGIALTLVTGALRIASDNHWSTDVSMGHLVGFASGYLIPTLFYYRAGVGRRRTIAVLPALWPGGGGARVLGRLD